MSKGLDERKRVGAITVSAAERKRALRGVKAQLRQWELVMPPHAPLVLDFGLGDFYRTGLVEYWVANELEAGYCGKLLFVFGGQSCPLHRHKTKHETFFVVRGKARMALDGVAREMRPGDCLPVPPGKLHGFTGAGPCLLLEVSRPCLVKDNFFENRSIPIGGNWRKPSRDE